MGRILVHSARHVGPGVPGPSPARGPGWWVRVRTMTGDGAAATPSLDSGPELMAGFPPAPRSQVTLANWQDPPFNRWAFRHMRELIPSQLIAADPGRQTPLAASPLALPDPP